MYNVIGNEFRALSGENKHAVWELLMRTPIYTQMLTQARDELKRRYFDLPEPESFEPAEMAAKFSEKLQIKAQVAILNELIAIDKVMREDADSITTEQSSQL